MIRLVFSLPMVRALRAGLKTQTRRVSPPRFKVGDVLGVAEPCTIRLDPGEFSIVRCYYAADEKVCLLDDRAERERCATMKTVQNATPRSGRFMPDWAVRTKVRITDIREERLGDITDRDAEKEGFFNRNDFLSYFSGLHKGPTDLTLPVWAIHFEVLT